MSLWKKIGKMVPGVSEVRARFDCPNSFRWSDDTLPMAVELLNGTDKGQTIRSLEIAIVPDRSGSNERRGHYDPGKDQDEPEHTYVHPLSIELAAGATEAFEIAVPLAGETYAGKREGKASRWLKEASKAMTGANADADGYRVTVRPVLEGMGTTRRHWKWIRVRRSTEKPASWNPKPQ